MSVIYVARSKSLSDWGAGVGISKSLFKVGICEGGAKQAVAALNEQECAKATDWTLVKAETEDALGEAEMLERLAARQTLLDPNYYPRLRGASGIFRVRPEAVENSVLLEKALAGVQSLNITIKPADFAAYLFKIARG